MVIKKLSEQAARYIHEKTNEESNIDDLYFGMQIVLNFLSIMVITSIFALIFHTLTDTFIGMVSFLIFRSLTGGYHLKYSEWCIVVSVVLLISMPFIATNFTSHYFVHMVVVCFILTAIFSPYDPNSTFLKNNKKLCKIVVLLSILLTYFIHSPLVLTSMMIQSLLLIHFRKKVE